ncbi:MAG: DUF2703 domain-containing protein [Eubacteriales bacterium]|nr:DUF2703 domain-containing protein [Eubacteriales bacterium]
MVNSSKCCGANQKRKQIQIDFLYLDLNICERCLGTDKNLDEAINQVSGVLKAAGFDIIINKVNITTKELAIRHEFISSPTIRINGKDIALDVKESLCEDCGDLCGDNVDCRVWTYNGVDYTEPPKELIVNAILKEVYSEKQRIRSKKEEYKLPYNLEVFFAGKANMLE